MTTQLDLLRKRFEDQQKDGLLDLKFVFGSLEEATLEEVCGEVNDLLDAIDRGEYEDSPAIGDSRRAK